MSTFRLILAIVVIFILSCLIGMFIHASLLKDDYQSIASLFRASGDVRIGLILVGYLSFAIGSVWMYAHGVEDKPWFGQGVRFGIAVWLVMAVPGFLIAYATQPLPEMLVAKQLGYEFIDKIILGLVTAAIVRRG